ncbi:hypothetical protein BOTBODRAFT_28036 [Botryobasidium botryosum FD-172 SS1]|uniref:Aldehyde dehydrogenase domain-containing protein n=1 Tax=Botryobasidium botryosum (strain FD-172 SS1) TaxID=930990 RepID=A0A067MXN3_BOTB1|nr:hypothetical protein BOTBODRAFT_28036 [Botryobasidium botryosum FD-172 SS1]
MTSAKTLDVAHFDAFDDKSVPCIIDNKPYLTSSTYDVLDPHTSQLLWSAYCVQPVDAVRAVESAAAAFPAWRATPIALRREIFIKAIQILKSKQSEYTALSVKETSLPTATQAGEIFGTAKLLEELVYTADAALRGDVVESPTQKTFIKREPFGVVFGVAPWNGPFTLCSRAFSDAVMAGNTCVLKTSEYSPKTHIAVVQAFIEAGLPPGVLNIVHVSPKDAPEITELLISHPAVRKVGFTGSARVGSIIGQLCGKLIKPVLLELGGMCPLIILPDADLEAAVNAAVYGSFMKSGQVCMSTNTIIVHESIATEFIATMRAQVDQLRASTDQAGPLRGLFCPGAVKRVQKIVQDALDGGANIVAGSFDVDLEHNVMQPLVLDNVTKDMDVCTQELFGPVVTIQRFKDDQEAIDLANDNDYGLSASVYGRDIERATNIANGVYTGNIHINGPTFYSLAHAPHGGVKNSGYGRFNGAHGIREFTFAKVLTINEPRKYSL